ncbi:MAG: hypothetical protein A2078_03800 [Nitrospirae bacterium GWC2_57_9]|nr:MAG: hypothetical protein A2078_03800 [Nitrospirae bacterium GWC2_57_9]
MKKAIIISMAAALIMAGMVLSAFAREGSRCKATDKVCRDFEALADAEQFEAIAGKVDKSEKYSQGSRHYIGRAYLALAASENNTPQQEEAFCRKALEFGASQAYMGLYFIHVQKNEEQALGYLREYVKTKPADSVPYVILGESELGKKNYHLADAYLREAKRLSRANSPGVDWMLFQANYLLGNYQYASEVLDRALKNGNGRFEQELRMLSSDARFQGIAKRPEFRNMIPG